MWSGYLRTSRSNFCRLINSNCVCVSVLLRKVSPCCELDPVWCNRMQKAICDPTFEDSIILGQRGHSWQRQQMFPSVNKSFISALFDLCHCQDFKLSFPCSNRAMTSAFFAPPPPSRKPRLFIIHSFTWNHTTPLHLLFLSPPLKALRSWHIGSAPMFYLGESISSRREIAQWKPNSRSDSKRLLAGWTCKTFHSFSSRLKAIESAKRSLEWKIASLKMT